MPVASSKPSSSSFPPPSSTSWASASTSTSTCTFAFALASSSSLLSFYSTFSISFGSTLNSSSHDPDKFPCPSLSLSFFLSHSKLLLLYHYTDGLLLILSDSLLLLHVPETKSPVCPGRRWVCFLAPKSSQKHHDIPLLPIDCDREKTCQENDRVKEQRKRIETLTCKIRGSVFHSLVCRNFVRLQSGTKNISWWTTD